MAGLTLDAGALVAYARGQERIRQILAVGYERGFVPTIPAIALATSDPDDMRALLGNGFTILVV